MQEKGKLVNGKIFREIKYVGPIKVPRYEQNWDQHLKTQRFKEWDLQNPELIMTEDQASLDPRIIRRTKDHG